MFGVKSINRRDMFGMKSINDLALIVREVSDGVMYWSSIERNVYMSMPSLLMP